MGPTQRVSTVSRQEVDEEKAKKSAKLQIADFALNILGIAGGAFLAGGASYMIIKHGDYDSAVKLSTAIFSILTGVTCCGLSVLTKIELCFFTRIEPRVSQEV